MRERLASERRKLREGRSVAFAITDRETETFAGEALLHTFDWQHSRAAAGIWLRRAARGRGLGADALRLICSFGQEELGLARIEMTTFPDNAGMVAIAERTGFRAEGVLRSYTLERGMRCDVAMYSLLPGELR